MNRKDDTPRSITTAIIYVRLSSEPLSPQGQEQMRQEAREILKHRQHYVDVARGQLRFNY